MSIYDKAPFDVGKLLAYKKHVAILIAVIVIAFLAYQIIINFQPTPIKANFSKNPISIAEGKTNLSVTITNTTAGDSGRVYVDVQPVDIKTLTVSPVRQEISLLGAGENRKLDFEVSVREGQTVYPGKYTIVVEAIINEQSFTQEFTLTLVN